MTRFQDANRRSEPVPAESRDGAMQGPSRRAVVSVAGLLMGLSFGINCESPDAPSVPEVHVTPFLWKGRLLKFSWIKAGDNQVKGLRIYDPENDILTSYNGDIFAKDGEVYPDLPGGVTPTPNAKLRPRAAGAISAYLCVLDTYAEDLVRIFDLTTFSLLASIPVTEDPIGVDISPDGRLIYVSHLADTLPQVLPPRVSVIDAVAHRVLQTVSLPDRIHPGIPLMSPDGSVLYVPNGGQFVSPAGYMGASVILIDPARNQMTGEIPLSNANTPAGVMNSTTIDKLAITPDGTLLFAIARQFGPARLFVIDTINRAVATSTIIPDTVSDLLMDASGSRLYIATNSAVSALDQHAVRVYDTASLTQLANIAITGTGDLNRLALSWDGGSLFANPQFRPFILRIDISTNQIAERISFGTDNPDNSMAFVIP